MRRENSDFQTYYVSEAGTPKVNKDYFGYVEMDDFACYVVADGFDTDREVCAAKMVTDYILGNFTARPSMSKRRMRRILCGAHELLRRESVRMRLKTSIMVVMTDYMKVSYAMAGNTRFYLFRNQKILMKSHDQSFYQHDIDAGKIPDDGSREFEERHNLLQYLGQPRKLRPFFSKKYKLEDADVLLLTSSGLWEQFHDIEILDALDANNEAEGFVLDLQDMLLSKKKNGEYIGNFTAASVFAKKLFKKPDNRRKIMRIVLMIAIPLLIIGITLGILYWRSNKKWTEQKESVAEIETRADGYVNDRDYERAQSEYAKAVEEAANLKQKNGKKGNENKALKVRLDEKSRITQLLADGNRYLEEKNYSKAMQSFKDAKRLLDAYSGEDIDLDDINSQDIQDKINRSQTLLNIEDQMKLADLKTASGDYDGALDLYNDARQKAISAGESEMEQDLNLKAAEAQANAKGSKSDALKNEGMLAESAGDQAMSAGNYVQAASSYRQAAASYGAASYAEGVASVNGKLTQIDAKMAAEGEQLKAEEEEAKAQEEQNKLDEEKAFIDGLKAEAKKKEAQGDRDHRNQNYDAAYEIYEDAYDLYSETGMSEKAQMVLRKMDKITAAQEKEEQSEQKLTAQDWENMGNQALDELDYDAAMAYYQMAQSMYQEAGLQDKVLQTEGKMRDAKELKRRSELPTPTPSPTPEPTPTPTPEVIIVFPG